MRDNLLRRDGQIGTYDLATALQRRVILGIENAVTGGREDSPDQSVAQGGR